MVTLFICVQNAKEFKDFDKRYKNWLKKEL